jgi:hypothetical protein
MVDTKQGGQLEKRGTYGLQYLEESIWQNDVNHVDDKADEKKESNHWGGRREVSVKVSVKINAWKNLRVTRKMEMLFAATIRSMVSR